MRNTLFIVFEYLVLQFFFELARLLTISLLIGFISGSAICAISFFISLFIHLRLEKYVDSKLQTPVLRFGMQQTQKRKKDLQAEANAFEKKYEAFKEITNKNKAWEEIKTGSVEAVKTAYSLQRIAGSLFGGK